MSAVTLPSHLLKLAKSGARIPSMVAVDTETSGLYPDSGARISTVSIAFLDFQDEPEWLNRLFPNTSGPFFEPLSDFDLSHSRTWGREKIDQWEEAPVVSFAWPFDQGVEGTGKEEDRGEQTLWPETENLSPSEFEALLELLKIWGSSYGLTMHHAKFDSAMFRAGLRLHPELTAELIDLVQWDTQNVSDLLYSRFVHVRGPSGARPSSSLKPVSSWLWGDSESDEQQVIKRYLAQAKLPSGRWDLIPWTVIRAYAEQDARLTIRLQERQLLDLQHDSFKDWLDGEDGRLSVEEAVARRLEVSKLLYRVERRGLPFSVSAARKARAEIASRVRKLESSLPFAPATLPAAKSYFFTESGLNLPPYAVTEKGQPQLDQQTVQKMVRDRVPNANTWRDIQKLQTASSRWYEGWTDRAGADGRLRTSVRQNGTVSGRFSVENIQLQAIPHDYKLSNFEILDGIPSPRTLIDLGVPPGFKLWELDLANAELRVAALFAGCSRMLELIESGADLHADAAVELFNMEPGSPRWGEFRQVAKRFNFSAIFGVGPSTLQGDVEEQTGIRMSYAEVESLLHRWNGLYPEFQRSIRQTMDVVERRARRNGGYGWVQIANGERRWFLPGEDTHKAFNQRVQPSLAQFGIDWWISVDRAMVRRFGDELVEFGSGFAPGRIGVVLMVHDSVVLLVPDSAEGEDAVREAQKLGVDLWAQRFPGVPGGVDASPWADHS